MQPNVTVSLVEAAQRLNVSRATIYRLIRSDELRTLKVRRRRLVRVEELDRFASRMERQASH